MTRYMRLAILTELNHNMLYITRTRFASMIMMFKRHKFLKYALQNMIISNQWNAYKEYDISRFEQANM
jgi:hypothetical protein